MEQKRWVVRRLDLQVKFNDKLHQHNQQSECITLEYKAEFPEDAGREKASLLDAVWDKEDSNFKEWCKTRALFWAGMTSGLQRDQQDSILAAMPMTSFWSSRSRSDQLPSLPPSSMLKMQWGMLQQ